MKYIHQTCRILVGCLFIFSGFIKLNDPVGTAIKLEEYFEVFSEFFNTFFQRLNKVEIFHKGSISFLIPI